MRVFEKLKGLVRKPRRELTEEERILRAARIGGGLGPEENKQDVRWRRQKETTVAPVILPAGVAVNINLGNAAEGDRPRIVTRILNILGKKTTTAEERRKRKGTEEVQRMVDHSQ